jgi:hypothetical protein
MMLDSVLLDWSLKGHNPQLLCTSVSDFPQPAFDQLGMQPVPSLALNNSPSAPTGNIGSRDYLQPIQELQNPAQNQD